MKRSFPLKCCTGDLRRWEDLRATCLQVVTLPCSSFDELGQLKSLSRKLPVPNVSSVLSFASLKVLTEHVRRQQHAAELGPPFRWWSWAVKLSWFFSKPHHRLCWSWLAAPVQRKVPRTIRVFCHVFPRARCICIFKENCNSQQCFSWAKEPSFSPIIIIKGKMSVWMTLASLKNTETKNHHHLVFSWSSGSSAGTRHSGHGFLLLLTVFSKVRLNPCL